MNNHMDIIYACFHPKMMVLEKMFWRDKYLERIKIRLWQEDVVTLGCIQFQHTENMKVQVLILN